MKNAVLGLLLILACASGASAQLPAHVFPHGPTSATPVEIHALVSCPYVSATVTREGSLIRVQLTQDLYCTLILALPSVLKVPIPGLLPPGSYRVEMRFDDQALTAPHPAFGHPLPASRDEGLSTPFSPPRGEKVPKADEGSIYATTQFVVRNAGPKPFEIHPFAVPSFNGTLRLRLSGVECSTSDCSDVDVAIDGTTAGPLERRSDGSIWFTAPSHEEGLVDVTVRKSDFVQVSPAALYYFDAPESSVFEHILFPVLEDAEGAHGSHWVTEATISNPRPWFVENASYVEPMTCVLYPCGERMMPGETRTFDGDWYPHGAILLAPRPEAPDLAFGLRARDTSRHAEGLGTRIPVVREKDMVHGESIELLDVPVDPRYRVKVRIYLAGPTVLEDLPGSMSIVRGASAEKVDFMMTPAEGNVPAYAEIDLPAGATHERVNLIITPPLDATAWAFATVTNNQTQQVTIITP
jgi:hypothetical protein